MNNIRVDMSIADYEAMRDRANSQYENITEIAALQNDNRRLELDRDEIKKRYDNVLGQNARLRGDIDNNNHLITKQRAEIDSLKNQLAQNPSHEKLRRARARNADLRLALNHAQQTLAMVGDDYVEPGSKFNGDLSLLDSRKFQERFNTDLLSALQPFVEGYGFGLVAIQAEFVVSADEHGNAVGFEMRLGPAEEKHDASPDFSGAYAQAAADSYSIPQRGDIGHAEVMGGYGETLTATEAQARDSGHWGKSAKELRDEAIARGQAQDREVGKYEPYNGANKIPSIHAPIPADAVGISAEVVEVTRAKDGVHLFIPGLELVPMRDPEPTPTQTVRYDSGAFGMGAAEGNGQLNRA